MANVIKKYWDIFGGIVTTIFLTMISKFELTKVQLCSYIIMLLLVNIGVFKVIKQAIDNKRQRHHNLIDSAVDNQRPVKAIRMAQHPTEDGEEIGKVLIKIWGGIKKIMEKLKTFWSKFKGYILTVALFTLSMVEYCGGFINDLCGGALTINDIEVLPMVTLAATVVVGLISNGYSKEQRDAIKVLLNAGKTKEVIDPAVKAQLKVKLVDSESSLKTLHKGKSTLEAKLKTLNNDLTSAKTTYDAKVKLFNMQPQLATNTEVNEARAEVTRIEANINSTKAELEKCNALITTTTTTINAIKGQL